MISPPLDIKMISLLYQRWQWDFVIIFEKNKNYINRTLVLICGKIKENLAAHCSS